MSESTEPLSDFERSLRGLMPKTGLDRDRLIFEAGVRSVRRRSPRVSAVGLLMVGLLIGSGVTWIMRPTTAETPTIAKSVPAIQEPESPSNEPSAYGPIHQRLVQGDLSLPQSVAWDEPRSLNDVGVSLAEQRRRLMQQ
jgi:hypothetical protein